LAARSAPASAASIAPASSCSPPLLLLLLTPPLELLLSPFPPLLLLIAIESSTEASGILTGLTPLHCQKASGTPQTKLMATVRSSFIDVASVAAPGSAQSPGWGLHLWRVPQTTEVST
jgi:hypothetical protein